MARKKTSLVVNKSAKKAGDAIALDGAAPLKIKALPNVKYLLKTEGDVGPENATLTRVGNDLHVTLEGETSPALVLEGYFGLSEPSGLYGVAEDGQLYAYGRTDGADIFSLANGEMAPIALAGNPVPPGPVGEDDGFAFWPLLLGGGLLLAGIAAVANNGGGRVVIPPPPPDEKPPEPPVEKPVSRGIGSVIDDFGTITGDIRPGGATDDSTPTFNGIGTPGNVIEIFDNGKSIGSVKVSDGGTWSLTPVDPIEDGSHSVTVIETDKDGNKSDPSDAFDFTVVPSPVSSGVDKATDDYGPLTGDFLNGGATDDQTPTFHGKGGAPGNTITIFDNGVFIGTATVNDRNEWSFTPKEENKLGEGPHSITTTESSEVGTSDPSGSFTFEVDVTPPDQSKLAITGVEDDVAPVTGNVPSGGTTDDSHPVIKGTGTAT